MPTRNEAYLQRVCLIKKTFRSMHEALLARDRVLKHGRRSHVAETEAYKCPLCGKYHLGHNRYAQAPVDPAPKG